MNRREFLATPAALVAPAAAETAPKAESADKPISDQEALDLISYITSDDFCAHLEMLGASDGLTGDLKTAESKLSAIYRIAHSMDKWSPCHHVHDDWRKEAKVKHDAIKNSGF